ncbi:MAG: DUF4397 domain-containing protein [Ignavibacteria bacterium]|nr:DUF4397 domain-containing protein [Ignavibacteria bacterium]
MNVFFSTLVFLLAIVFCGCQCIPNLETDREISPSQYAKVMCVNALPNVEKIKITVGNILLHSALTYEMEEGFRYFNVPYGVINFNIAIKNDSIIYKGMANLQKGKAYTFFVYQMQRRAQGLLLEDDVSTYSLTNSYFRFVNLLINSPHSLLFSIEHQYPIVINLVFKTYTKFYTTYPDKYVITIKDAEKDSIIAQSKNFQLLPGKGYTIVLRGDYLDKTKRLGPNLLVIQHDFEQVFEINEKK